jgi:hypothetical protein
MVLHLPVTTTNLLVFCLAGHQMVTLTGCPATAYPLQCEPAVQVADLFAFSGQ